jgi:hypothetical protein
MSPDHPSALPANGPLESEDSSVLHRQLAHWNRERLAVGTPSRSWADDLRREHAMRLVEGGFIERFRAEVAAQAAEAPEDPDGFVAWFEALKGRGPGESDPLFPCLAEEATLEETRWFLLQEVAGEAGFEDLTAYTQVKMPVAPKLELARNYWDEMGHGAERGMHGPMLARLADALDLRPTIEGTLWQSLALGNTMAALATTRRYAYQSVGALGVVELTAPWRSAHVDRALRRLGVGRARQYFTVHATLDIKHSEDWNREVLRPLVAERPECARHMAEGALMRLTCGQRCFQAYRGVLWGQSRAVEAA